MNLNIILLIIKIITILKCVSDTEGKETRLPIEEIWWGPDELKGANNTSIRPFRVVFSEEMISDLRYRLLNNRASKPTLPHVGFEYGFNTREAPTWLNYWANYYPFEEREEFFNQFPQFKTNIQGLDIHFIRVTPEVPPGVELVPLLLLHGWPGSVREFYEAIPLLTAVSPDRDFAVEVVAPHLPGFGFSDAASRPGLSSERMAVVLRNLMRRLGHEKFYVQGGDWGALTGANLATMFQDEVLGYHTNLALVAYSRAILIRVLGALNPSLVVEPALAGRMYPIKEKALNLLRESAYLHFQATKPDTIGVGLSDSPAGLLAYIFQIVSSATRIYYVSREDGGLHHYPRETLIDNLMVYWTSNCISTSFRIYIETLNREFSTDVKQTPTVVPTWALQAKYEIVYEPPSILKTKFLNLLHTTVLDDGGHFFALEMPQIFSDDVLTAVNAFREWHKENFTSIPENTYLKTYADVPYLDVFDYL